VFLRGPQPGAASRRSSPRSSRSGRTPGGSEPRPSPRRTPGTSSVECRVWRPFHVEGNSATWISSPSPNWNRWCRLSSWSVTPRTCCTKQLLVHEAFGAFHQRNVIQANRRSPGSGPRVWGASANLKSMVGFLSDSAKIQPEVTTRRMLTDQCVPGYVCPATCGKTPGWPLGPGSGLRSMRAAHGLD